MFYQAHTLNLDTNEWSLTDFDKRKDAVAYIKTQVKYPGQYNLKHADGVWNNQARFFQQRDAETGTGHYPKFRNGSIDFRKHWDFEKEKCLFEGFIIYRKPSEGVEFAVPCLYYWYLNYCPIPDKVKQKDDFADIYDGDYHYYIYILRCVLQRKFSVVVKKRQSGFQQPVSSLVLKKDGWVTIGSLKPGDLIMNPDGVEQTVTEIFPQGIKDVYEVEFIDGRTTRCGEEHLWKVLDKRAKKWKTLQTKDILQLGVTTVTHALTLQGIKEYEAYRFAVPLVSPVPFFEKKQIVDPYLLGYLIGNGSFQGSVRVTTPDKETIDRISDIIGEDYSFAIDSDRSDKIQCRYRINYKYSKHVKHSNPLTKSIYDVGLEDTNTYTKFIPENYLHGSIDQRIALLQGLMDSDGYINAYGRDIHYTTVNTVLAEQVCYIVRSLGLKCKVDKKDKQKETHLDFYRVRISGPIIFDLFRLGRKLSRQGKRVAHFDNLPIVAIKKLAIQEESVCISVDHPNHLYVTDNFVVTHNTLKNMSIMLNSIWFGESSIAKMFASDISKVEESWSFMEGYRDHINEHCGWKRGFDPSKKLDWQIRRKQTDGSYRGNNSKAKGFTTKQDYTNGIGGSARVIFGEEAGANSTLDLTHEFITSNVSYGGLTTGLIMYSGAVGNLEHSDPLKQFITRPNDNGFLGCVNNIDADLEFGDEVGFFVPEWWNYVSVEEDENGVPVGEALKCFDQDGNTNMTMAIAEVLKWRKLAEQKTPEKYRYYCSQRPLSIKEAFDFRTESKFPQRLIQAQKRRIEDKIYHTEYVDIIRNTKGDLEFIPTTKFPIKDFPISKVAADKEGCIVVWEKPFMKNPDLGRYYVASIDPVDVGQTTSTDSLYCILVYKLDVEVERHGDTIEKFIEPGKLVCEWTGRFDDPNKNHDRARDILEMYGARAAVEINISSFVNYMIYQKKLHYLLAKSELVLLKELGSNTNSFQEYGWRKTGKIFENHLIPMIVEFLKEVLSQEALPDGKVVKTTYGVERLGGAIMILKEMELYHDGLNVDRLVSLGGLVMAIKIIIANRGYAKRVEVDEAHKKTKGITARPNSFFKNIGNPSSDTGINIKRSPFRNIR